MHESAKVALSDLFVTAVLGAVHYQAQDTPLEA
jgi:hypothetical protein